MECGDTAKAIEQTANRPEQNYELGSGEDTIDRSQLLVTTLPNVINIIGYASEEHSVEEPDASEDSPTSANDITITALPGLIAEILKELREYLINTSPGTDGVTAPENGEL